MIPQSIKDILGNSGDNSIFQTIAMLFFLVLFLVIVYWVFSRPKKYYDEEANAPLNDDIVKDNDENL